MDSVPFNSIKTIFTCPGIGDTIWLFQKLINQPEKFHWRIGNGSPQRGHQIFELLPSLVESFEYIPQLGYKKVKRNGFRGKWAAVPYQFYLEANGHLEAGLRIENFLPDLPTKFILPYNTSLQDSVRAFTLINPLTENKYIGIYTSAYSNARHWGGWQAEQWLELIRLIREHDQGYIFVIIGASYDVGIPEEIMARLNPGDYINTVGEPLSVVVEILKRLDCFIGFPSGLSIINETVGARQTIMFYPNHLAKLINSWPDPERIENGSYKGCLFCEPQNIFQWMKDNKKI